MHIHTYMYTQAVVPWLAATFFYFQDSFNLRRKKKHLLFGLGWFLCLMAYQPSWVI